MSKKNQSKKIRIGIIREGKVPPDFRVALSPEACEYLMNKYPQIEIYVQPSPSRCFEDDRYAKQNITLSENMASCDILIGIKEVPIKLLIPEKKYFFFSHTIKKQPYNRPLLQAIVANKIELYDYEGLKNKAGNRVVAFGKFAGMVGAHNALWTYGQRTGLFELPRMKDLRTYVDMTNKYKKITWPPVKIVLSGTGRVGHGAAKVLRDMGIQRLTPEKFLRYNGKKAVYTQLENSDYVAAKDGGPYVKKDFYTNPGSYKSTFKPFAEHADIFINGIFYDSRGPAFFTVADMARPSFKIRVIADVTCDIAPESSIPSTLYATTIDDPIYGFDPHQKGKNGALGKVVAPHGDQVIDMMTIDNLPNELAVDASEHFGKQLIKYVFPGLLYGDRRGIVGRAHVTNGKGLTPGYQYLSDYLHGK